MPTELERQIEDLFQEAAALPPAQRDSFLHQRCSDSDILHRVQLLLRHDISESAFLRGAAQMQVAPSPAPQQIGRYRILSVLGHGGMGTVYEAEQDKPHRKVALKVIRPGWMSPAMLRRFEYEAEVLARLDHPGIARIYDAGTADTGHGPQPYFAMELVAGTRLDELVRQSNPPLKQRLELLIEICQAVHHAHTKGVIHRDLKPANILITGESKPKILDFGVARATDSDIQSTTLHTESGQLLGTLPYMAPEQAAGRAHELDTSSDVYALGVIAYELLSGKLPYAVQNKPLHEAVRVICEDEPSRLSSVDRSLRGDVETIVGKALEKDRTRRYHTAGELAGDVKRYLDYEPISARPPGTWYQVSKFARRNKLLVGGAAILLFVLTVATVVSTWQALRATSERRRADEQAAIATAVNDFQSTMLASADPSNRGDKVTVLEVTQAAVRELDAGKLKDQPLVEAAVRHTIGQTLLELGRYDDAEPVSRRSLELRREFLSAGNPDIAQSLNNFARVVEALGRTAEAERLHREALEIRRRSLPVGDPDIAQSLNNLAGLLSDQGKPVEAEVLLREALEIDRNAFPPGHEQIALKTNNLAVLLRDQGQFAEAERLCREVLEMDRKTFPAGHASIATDLSNLARVLEEQGKLSEAEPLLRETLKSRRQTHPEGHPDIAKALNNLSVVLLRLDKLSEAESTQREALEIYRKTLPAGANEIANSLNNLANVYQSQGKLTEAEATLRESLAMRRNTLPPLHPYLASTLNNLAESLRHQGKMKEAEVLLREALDIRRKALLGAHPDVAMALISLAAVLHEEGKPADAEPLLREAIEIQRSALTPEHPDVAHTLSWLFVVLRQLGRYDECEQMCREALEIRRKALPPNHLYVLDSLDGLATFLFTQRRVEEAAQVAKELYQQSVSSQADPGRMARYASVYGVCLAKLQRWEEAEVPLRTVYERMKSTRQQKHERMRGLVTALAELCDHTNRPDEAATWRAELVALQAATQPATAPATAPIRSEIKESTDPAAR